LRNGRLISLAYSRTIKLTLPKLSYEKFSILSALNGRLLVTSTSTKSPLFVIQSSNNIQEHNLTFAEGRARDATWISSDTIAVLAENRDTAHASCLIVELSSGHVTSKIPTTRLYTISRSSNGIIYGSRGEDGVAMTSDRGLSLDIPAE
jgi:hypothetical protein